MPYLKPYSLPWLEFAAQKARIDMEAGSDPARILAGLVDDVEHFAEHNRKKSKRDVPEEERKRRSERMKAIRASGLGGWPKKSSNVSRNANDGVINAEG